jgi:hypothetical protein
MAADPRLLTDHGRKPAPGYQFGGPRKPRNPSVLRDLDDALTPAGSAEQVARRLDGIAAIMESTSDTRSGNCSTYWRRSASTATRGACWARSQPSSRGTTSVSQGTATSAVGRQTTLSAAR